MPPFSSKASHSSAVFSAKNLFQRWMQFGVVLNALRIRREFLIRFQSPAVRSDRKNVARDGHYRGEIEPAVARLEGFVRHDGGCWLPLRVGDLPVPK